MDLPDSGAAAVAPTARERLHDLRTLLTVIVSGGHMLGDSIEPERRAKIVAAIEDAAMRGANIATALLASSYEAPPEGHYELGRRIAGLKPLLETLAGDRISLRIDAVTRPTLVRCRPDRLDHIMLELVSNACRATDPGGTVTLRARRVGTRVWILVADNGRGMSSDKLRQLMGPLDALPVGPHGGGLRQVRCFARETGARLRIRSRPDKGTVVALVLPVVLPERRGPKVRATEQPGQAGRTSTIASCA